jgi:pSer/pThr/pTyr-binding forkhead associated (FHA) protein
VEGLPPELRSRSATEVAERLGAERGGEPFLLYRDGEGRQRIADLDGGARTVCIGRGPANEVALAWDEQVSRVHAVLERAGDDWTVVDEGLSRNGTFVNGRRLRGRRRLVDGDTIAVGRTRIAFAAPAGAALQPTETAREGGPPALSPAQQRVLDALCRPFAESRIASPPSNREIAGELFVSVETVKSHMRTLFSLFGVDDLPQNRKRAELARRALERGATLTEH